MRTTGILLVSILLATTLTAPAIGTGCAPGRSEATFTLQNAAGYTFYLVWDIPGSRGEIGSAYLYAENYVFAGLQRADFQRDDTCGGAFPGDHLIL